MHVKILLLVSLGLFCVLNPVFADKPADAGVQVTEVLILEDWAITPVEPAGTVTCPGGELDESNPVMPVCPASGRIHFRRGGYLSCTTSADDRLQGIVLGFANGNFDANYTGPVWGTWMLVPYEPCNPLFPIDLQVVLNSAVYWKGTWHGQRTRDCFNGQCTWTGDLYLVGKGYGGNIDGIHFKGNETVTTFTGLPVPWEFLAALGLPGGPEGIIEATIKE